MSPSAKPRLAGRQPSSVWWGAPGDDRAATGGKHGFPSRADLKEYLIMTTTDADTTLAQEANEHLLPVAVTSSLVPGSVRVTNQARQHEFVIDEPASLGGDDQGATPVEHLLASLGACTAISYQVWAEKLELTVDRVDVTIDGTIDLQGFFGLADDVRPGFQGINLDITVTGPHSAADYQRLADTVEQHCPVLDNLTHGVPVTRTLVI